LKYSKIPGTKNDIRGVPDVIHEEDIILEFQNLFICLPLEFSMHSPEY
jgi:hypothetical protein